MNEGLRLRMARDRGVSAAFWGMHFAASFRDRGSMSPDDAKKQMRRMGRRLRLHRQKSAYRFFKGRP